MIDKTDAGGDAYFLETHSLGKLTNLLDTRPLAVARCLDHGRNLGDAANLRIFVFTGRVVDALRIYLCGAIPGTIRMQDLHTSCRVSGFGPRGYSELCRYKCTDLPAAH